MSRFYNEELKWELYGMYLNGYSYSDLAHQFNMSDVILSKWFSQIRNILSERKDWQSLKNLIEQASSLKKQVTLLNKEKSFLRETGILLKLPKKSRIQVAQELVPVYGPNLVCRMLALQKANLYYHTSYRESKTVYEKKDEQLLPYIMEIMKCHNYAIGSERIRLLLKDKGLCVSKKKILNLMQQVSIERSLKYAKKKKGASYHLSIYENLLNRHFNQKAPNLAWVSDITEIKTKKQKYYLCVILDLFSRKVIAYSLSEYNTTELTRRTFLQAYSIRNMPTNILFHSDQGAQYTSLEFRELLASRQVRQSFSNPGVPYDNAAMESFFSHIKKEELNRYTFPSKHELWYSIVEYITFYNEKRPHSSIGNIPPVQAEQAFMNMT